MAQLLRPKIFEAVDALKQRKCRPDRESIAHYILRRYGIKFLEVFNELEIIVDEELLIKVEYKGSISYRTPSQLDTRSSPLLTKHSKILNSIITTRFIMIGVNELLNANESYNIEGIPFNELILHLKKIEPERFKDLKAIIAVERELFSKSGNLFKSQKGRLFPKDIPIPDEGDDDDDGSSNIDGILEELVEQGSLKKVAAEDDKIVKKVIEEQGSLIANEETEELKKLAEVAMEKTKKKGRGKNKNKNKPIPPKPNTETEGTSTSITPLNINVTSIETENLTKKKRGKKRKIVQDSNIETVSNDSSSTKPDSTISSSTQLSSNPKDWTSSEVEIYFQIKGLKEEGAILKEQEIDGLSLLLMRRRDIVHGLPKLLLGPALKVYRLVTELQKC